MLDTRKYGPNPDLINARTTWQHSNRHVSSLLLSDLELFKTHFPNRE